MEFENAVKKVNLLYKELVLQKKYPVKDLTEGTVKDILSTQTSVSGIFILYEEDKPVYAGRSANLAQRIGKDLRANVPAQANITKRLLDGSNGQFKDMNEARKYFYSHYTVQILRVDNEYLRALLQIYIAMELGTKYNSFLEH